MHANVPFLGYTEDMYTVVYAADKGLWAEIFCNQLLIDTYCYVMLTIKSPTLKNVAMSLYDITDNTQDVNVHA